MDPNACLNKIRRRTGKLLEQDLSDHAMIHAALELAEHVEALDEWLCKGGFMPSAWERGPVKPHEVV